MLPLVACNWKDQSPAGWNEKAVPAEEVLLFWHPREDLNLRITGCPTRPGLLGKQFSERYGIPGLHLHKLRHSFASVAVTNGADIASVSEKPGRGDKAVTLRMYTHADQESIKRASQIFRDALKKA